MDFTIRPARESDLESIAAFTRDTFEWGDYVAEVLPRWLASPRGRLLVAADVDDRAIGMGRVSMISPSEAWLQGMRVDPAVRRRGIAGTLTTGLLEAAAEAGAAVARLAVEEGNDPAHAQVDASGFRRAGEWIRATRRVDRGGPVPDGNGGRRVPPQERLAAVNAREVMPAFMAWTSGSLARSSRGLFCLSWRWRRLTESDLEAAAKNGALWTAPSGWAVAAPDDERLEVAWLETGEDDAFELVRAVYELGASQGMNEVALTVPDVPWLRSRLERIGFASTGYTVYETGV